jgi:hypothetical protein
LLCHPFTLNVVSSLFCTRSRIKWCLTSMCLDRLWCSGLRVIWRVALLSIGILMFGTSKPYFRNPSYYQMLRKPFSSTGRTGASCHSLASLLSGDQEHLPADGETLSSLQQTQSQVQLVELRSQCQMSVSKRGLYQLPVKDNPTLNEGVCDDEISKIQFGTSNSN